MALEMWAEVGGRRNRRISLPLSSLDRQFGEEEKDRREMGSRGEIGRRGLGRDEGREGANRFASFSSRTCLG